MVQPLIHTQARVRPPKRMCCLVGEFHLAIQVASAYFSGVGGDVCIPIKVVGRDAGGDESSEEED